MARQRLIVGNWKMNGLRASLSEVEILVAALSKAPPRARVAICPPATLLPVVAPMVKGSLVEIGGQDCHPELAGAFTGDISAPMLRDAGATHVILGHSERRALHHEPNELVSRKLTAAQASDLSVILCAGETQSERDGGRQAAIVRDQLERSIAAGADPSRLAIAYEPVWAIGTGRVASVSDIREMHALVRLWLNERFGSASESVAVLYGGSVKPDNAADVLRTEGVDGALVGGASLKAADFLKIISAA